ncbi:MULTISPECIES: UDP-glucose dehydrogenase family protein [Caldilinea]|jgi:UDPglucose 6-dehydrogenase|uniref:UDP-glucose 6-dehydrogenase n=2 Tax=Caldilinea aerophila TaxID=133453 RepID=I0I8J4_CALAS|nr:MULTISPECIES: UDP-glucose/GDP-mannose dehydrogenase family protein [Caldilinea]MBO9391931.1 UDP-glucose/GDP-mannose dehydrogenase family protein [Caldilinea sp.]BAM01582.1 putative UDP-glucose 6-dehydrogenase [Caldilinea aerophila DSM 14535 = NBRC 104270]
MRNIAVAGTGYVGLSTGTCFADMGNNVTCIDINEEKIAMLKRGESPIYEPGLSEMIVRNMKAGRLHFTTSYEEALKDAEFIFICVGTPSGVDGEADLQYVRMAAESVARAMTHPIIVINKSTVPVGTGDWVADIIRRSQPEPIDFAVVSCPEFTREGSAIYDFMNPDRVVIGSRDPEAAERVAQLHLPLRTRIIMTDLRTAEMIKYASNAFLATKISFINEIAVICEKLGADVREVAEGMGFDRRIGPQFLNAGLGYGGSCFPKDVKALEHMALVHGSHPSLLRAVIDINRDMRRWAVFNLRELLGGKLDGKRIGLMGLAFKPNTDDIREAPALEIAHMLRNEGAIVSGYDPVAMGNVARVDKQIRLAEDAYDLATGADALLVCTEWNEFKQLDLLRLRDLMAQPILVDGRNIYEPDIMVSLGFKYRGVGRVPRNANNS